MQEKPRSDSLQKMQEKKVVKGLIGFWSETSSKAEQKSKSKINENKEKPPSSSRNQNEPKRKSRSISHSSHTTQRENPEAKKQSSNSKETISLEPTQPSARESLKRSISELKIKFSSNEFQKRKSGESDLKSVLDKELTQTNLPQNTEEEEEEEEEKKTKENIPGESEKTNNPQQSLSSAESNNKVSSSTSKEKQDIVSKDQQAGNSSSSSSTHKTNQQQQQQNSKKTGSKTNKTKKTKESTPSSKSTTSSEYSKDKNTENPTTPHSKHRKQKKKSRSNTKSKTSRKKDSKVQATTTTTTTTRTTEDSKDAVSSAKSPPESETRRKVSRKKHTTSNTTQPPPNSQKPLKSETEQSSPVETEEPKSHKKLKPKTSQKLLEKAKKIKKAILTGTFQEQNPPSERLTDSRRNTIDLSHPSHDKVTNEHLKRSLSDDERILQKKKENLSKQQQHGETTQTFSESPSQPPTQPESQPQSQSQPQPQSEPQSQKGEGRVLVRSRHKQKAKSAPRILTRKAKVKNKNERKDTSIDTGAVPNLKFDQPSGNLSPQTRSPRKHSPRKSKSMRPDTEISSKVKKNLAEILNVREEIGMRYQKEDVELDESEASDDENDVNIWDEPPDSQNNIRFDSKNDVYVLSPGRPAVQTREGGRGLEIQCATFNKLVERLTFPDYNADDKIYMKVFIATYEDFTSPQRLLKKLIQRFQVPEGKMSKESMEQIQSRVCSVIKYWIDNYPSKMTRAMVERFRKFVNEQLKDPQHKPLREILTNSLETKLEKDLAAKARIKIKDETTPTNKPSLGFTVSAPIMRPYNVIDTLEAISDVEIARQITFVDYQIYNCIKPWEILKQVWRSQDTKYNVYNSGIKELTARFNSITNWVLTSILSQERPKDRVRLWVKFIKIAKQLRLMNNFNSLMAIIAGIHNNAIQRLTQTKSMIPKDIIKTMEKLDRLMSMKSNFRDYRELLYETQRPAIPFLGLILSDYTFIVDGNEPRIDNLINFSRCKLIYNNCIEILQHFQNAPYQFQPENFQIERMISRVKPLSAEEAYTKSCELEPPGPYELTLAGPDVASLMFNEKPSSSGGGGEKAPHTPKSTSGQSSTSRENANIKNKTLSEGKEKSDSSSTKHQPNPSASPQEKQNYNSSQDTSDKDNRNENKRQSTTTKSVKEAETKETTKERLDEPMSSLETDSEIEV